MPLTQPLKTIHSALKAQLVDDLAAALKSLQDLLPENSEKHKTVIALFGRLNDANKARLRDTLSNDDLQREYNRIRADLLDLVTGLKEADFETPATGAASAKAAAAKQGNVLYRIPHVMPLEKETRCVVRIALDEDAIVENISLDEHVQLKSLYRVSNTMQAEILDPSGGRVFHIRSTSEPVQIIDEQGYTEWRFYVIPHMEGAHPLEMKISIIEMKNGQPHKKELVLEETVQVVTESQATDDENEPMRAAVYAFAFQTTAPMLVAYEVTPSPSRFGGWQRTAALFIIFLITAGVWAITPQETRKWWMTRYIFDTPKAYRTYIEKYPKSKYIEEAELSLSTLENKAIEAIRQRQDSASVHAFLTNFPKNPRLEEVKRVVETKEDLKLDFLPEILEQIEQRDQEKEQSQRLDLSEAPTTTSKNLKSTDIVQTQSPEKPKDSEINPSEVVAPPFGINETELNETDPPIEEKQPEKTESAPSAQTTTIVQAIKPDMIFIKGGTFLMGDKDGERDEKPEHMLTLSNFKLGKYEVTFNEYDRFCEATGRKKPDDQGWGRGSRPVINISWGDAVKYCNWLSKQEGLKLAYKISGGKVTLKQNTNGYRLPSEAEWEYAAKGGSISKDYLYSGGNNLGAVAWYGNNSGFKTHPIGQKIANELGLHDMSGNVYEWCDDWYDADYYIKSTVVNPRGSLSGQYRVVRGGSWDVNLSGCRTTNRGDGLPGSRDFLTGFRLAQD